MRTGRMEEAEAERRRIRREEERDRRLPAGSGDSLIPTALNLAGTPENETVEAVEREIDQRSTLIETIAGGFKNE